MAVEYQDGCFLARTVAFRLQVVLYVMHAEGHKKIYCHGAFFGGSTTPIIGQVLAIVLVHGGAAVQCTDRRYT